MTDVVYTEGVVLDPNSNTCVESTVEAAVSTDAPLIEENIFELPVKNTDEVKEDQPAEEAKKEESIFAQMPPLGFDSPAHNVTITRETSKPGQGIFPESLSLPSASMSTQTKLIATFPNLKEVKNAADLLWAQTFAESIAMVPANGAIDSALSRPNSDWHQGLEINGELVRSAIPSFPKKSNQDLSGDHGLQTAFSHMGMGDFFHTGLFNSGFWVTFIPAPETVWLNINRLLGQDVTGISRETYGLLHSTATSLAISTIINSIIPYIYATSIDSNDIKIADIPKVLSSHDEHDFIWGFLSANYPHGVSMERACIVDPNTCRETIKEKLMVTELQIVDRLGLPKEAQIHMRNRKHGSMSLKSVKEYQERLTGLTDSVVVLEGTNGSKASFSLTIPSSYTKEMLTNTYIAEIRENIIATVTSEQPAEQRTVAYNELTTATELRMYQHWVKQITVDDVNNNVITDPATIARTLNIWTRDDKLRQQFFEAMDKFINSTGFSAIGMKPAKCPKCGGDHSRPEQKLRGKIDYIPLDIIQVFSYLAEFKSRLISARA